MAKLRTTILLVFVISVAPAILLVRDHKTSSQDVGILAAADSVVSAGMAESDVRIDWPVPDAYPANLRDLMALDSQPVDDAQAGLVEEVVVMETQRVQDSPGASLVEEVAALETEVLKEHIPSHREEAPEESGAVPVADVAEEAFVKETEVKETVSDASGTADQRDTEIKKTPEAVAVVDARHCAGLKYDELMRGRICFRKIWNGYDFVTQKVCLVEEGDGISSVWSFVQGTALVTEVQADSQALKDAIADASKPKR